MQLQPWGQVEGTYFAAGKPAAGQVLNIGTDGDEGFGGVLLWPDAYRARVDADGHFAFAKIPSGNFRLFNPRLGPSAFGWPFAKCRFARVKQVLSPVAFAPWRLSAFA